MKLKLIQYKHELVETALGYRLNLILGRGSLTSCFVKFGRQTISYLRGLDCNNLGSLLCVDFVVLSSYSQK